MKKIKKMKCNYCKKEIATNRSNFPYYDRHKDLYWHADCYLLLSNITSMDTSILRQLQKEVENELKSRKDDK